MKKKLIAFTLGLALLGGSAVAAVAATSDTQEITPNCCLQKAACCTEKAPCCK